LAYFVAFDIDGSLFFEAVSTDKLALETICRGEDIDSFEEIESEEEQEEAYDSQYSDFDFALIFHICCVCLVRYVFT
jgi:hypothetical protein